MTRFINCDYCGQRNHIDALCCEFCGGPVIMTELKVRSSWSSDYDPPFMLSCSTSAIDAPHDSELCSTSYNAEGEHYREAGRLSFMQDHGIEPKETQRRIEELEKRMERGSFRAGWSESTEDCVHAPDPPKRGWREWLGIGGRR